MARAGHRAPHPPPLVRTPLGKAGQVAVVLSRAPTAPELRALGRGKPTVYGGLSAAGRWLGAETVGDELGPALTRRRDGSPDEADVERHLAAVRRWLAASPVTVEVAIVDGTLADAPRAEPGALAALEAALRSAAGAEQAPERATLEIYRRLAGRRVSADVVEHLALRHAALDLELRPAVEPVVGPPAGVPAAPYLALVDAVIAALGPGGRNRRAAALFACDAAPGPAWSTTLWRDQAAPRSAPRPVIAAYRALQAATGGALPWVGLELTA